MADTWHDATEPMKGCLHCEDGKARGHYLHTEDEPCEDCVDEARTGAENIASGYGWNGEDV